MSTEIKKNKYRIWSRVTTWNLYSTVIAMEYSHWTWTWKYAINWSIEIFLESDLQEPSHYELWTYY
jgi:hypothetical protein